MRTRFSKQPGEESVGNSIHTRGGVRSLNLFTKLYLKFVSMSKLFNLIWKRRDESETNSLKDSKISKVSYVVSDVFGHMVYGVVEEGEDVSFQLLNPQGYALCYEGPVSELAEYCDRNGLEFEVLNR